MKVLVFGNPLVADDSIALRLLPALRKRFPEVEFKESDPSENLEKEGRDLLILDSVKGISEVALMEWTEAFGMSERFSMHDFDLPICIGILKKLGAIDSVRVIAVPHGCPINKALEGSAAIIASLLSGNASRSSCRGRRPL